MFRLYLPIILNEVNNPGLQLADSRLTLNSGVKNVEQCRDRSVEEAGWQVPERFTCGVNVRAGPCSGFFPLRSSLALRFD